MRSCQDFLPHLFGPVDFTFFARRTVRNIEVQLQYVVR